MRNCHGRPPIASPSNGCQAWVDLHLSKGDPRRVRDQIDDIDWLGTYEKEEETPLDKWVLLEGMVFDWPSPQPRHPVPWTLTLKWPLIWMHWVWECLRYCLRPSLQMARTSSFLYQGRVPNIQPVEWKLQASQHLPTSQTRFTIRIWQTLSPQSPDRLLRIFAKPQPWCLGCQGIMMITLGSF